MHKGKIILIPFPFTDLSGQKVRPAIVLYANKQGDDLVVCFISSKQTGKSEIFDIKVKTTSQNGLKMDSVIKVSKIATLEKKIVLGEIGDLDKKTIEEINKKLKILFFL